jgi:hypothetical protein
MNKSEERDKKLQHSCKESNKDVGKKDHACECDVSEDESRDLEAHDGSMWLGGVGTEGT